MTFPPKVWDGVLHRLAGELPPFAVDTWLRPLRPERAELPAGPRTRPGVAQGGSPPTLELVCPTPFHRDRVRDHYLERIRTLASEQIGQPIEIGLAVAATPVPARPAEAGAPAPDPDPPSEGPPSAPPPRDARTAPRRVRSHPPRREGGADLPVRSAPREGAPPRAAGRAAPSPRRAAVQQSFDNFVVGPCNALAREAAWAIARDEQLSLNQLYLAADTGMGKTHLARAVAVEARRLGASRVLYASAEDFTNRFMAAIRTKELGAFKRRHRRDCDVLILENVAFLEGKSQTQLELFHTVQELLDRGGRVLVTGSRLPRRLPGLDARLRDLLAAGFVAEVEAPDPELLREILRSKASGGGVRVPDECLELLVSEIDGSIRDLEGVLIQLVTTASLLKRPIDLALTREALEKKCSTSGPSRRIPEVGEVLAVVSSFFQTTPEALASRSRRRDVLVPRQLAMYLAHRFTDASLSEIGRALGRDHPSVKNAVSRVEREILERAPLRYQVEALSDRIESLRRGEGVRK